MGIIWFVIDDYFNLVIIFVDLFVDFIFSIVSDDYFELVVIFCCLGVDGFSVYIIDV